MLFTTGWSGGLFGEAALIVRLAGSVTVWLV